MATKKYTYALGRRKSSTARARLMPGKGSIVINSKTAADYFDNSSELLDRVSQALALLEKTSDYDISLMVSGGGSSGQADACRLAIANALAILDEANRGTLKKAGFLKRDPREKERKKYGLKRARKREQFSKR